MPSGSECASGRAAGLMTDDGEMRSYPQGFAVEGQSAGESLCRLSCKNFTFQAQFHEVVVILICYPDSFSVEEER